MHTSISQKGSVYGTIENTVVIAAFWWQDIGWLPGTCQRYTEKVSTTKL